MKKRFAALLCLLAAMLVLLIPWSSAASDYDGVYLVGVNDTVLLGLISENHMPVRRGGIIYAPYVVLDNKDLGLAYALNRSGGTFTIYNREHTLIFQLSGAGSVDKKGGEYPQGIITRNGVVYIPLRFVCNFFDLSYSFYNLVLPDGTVPIARLRTSAATLDDSQFGVQAAQLVSAPLNQYLSAKVTPTPTRPTATPTPTPAAPTPTPSSAPQAADVSFAIECTDPDGFSDVLATLGRYQVKALFLFPPETLGDQDTQVRSAAAAGHQIGLLLSTSDPADELRRGNDLLAHIIRYEATQVALRGDASAAQAALQGEDGVPLCWVWRENTRLRTGGAAAQARSLIQDVSDRGTAHVSLPSTPRAAQVLQRALPTLTQRPYTIHLQTEAS